ncbi:hypothetical protein PG994_007861 [Apiospora phragmitis]|uniref:DUF7053 domain-containing protein n=1 Tax=Apiospora phragmitis TaxID=2905665 RepID=A0ABR1URE5_9PEZI
MLSSITLTHTCKLPRNVTRQAVIEFLHSHEDIIDLSPLVKERHPIKAPASAPPHMQQQLGHASWWSITDKISYLPGHLLNGQYTYTGAFLNKATGLEAYIDAPAGTTLKDVWTVEQSPSSSTSSCPSCPSCPSSSQATKSATTTTQPGETDLYIRVDSSARCHFALRGFVRKMLKKSHAELVRRLAAKAQLNASAFGWSDCTSMSMSNDDFESVILRSKPSREWGGGSGGSGGNSGCVGTETPSPTETITSPSSFFSAVTLAPAAATTSPPLTSISEMADLYSFATHTGPFTAAEQAQTWSIPDTTANLQTGYNAWSAGRFWENDYRAHVGLNVGRGQTV